MNKKNIFITTTLVSLLGANANASNPASQEYVQTYVQSQIAKIPAGPQGPAGANGATGAVGPQGATGAVGLQGVTGATGPIGGSIDFADFFALMPSDNATNVAVGADVAFPQNGPASGTGLIARVGLSNSFNLALIGTYQIMFQVTVLQAGQLDLTLNGVELPYTVVGRPTGTSQIVGMALVQTTVINSIITVRNPVGESSALTIETSAGGTNPVSAHLVITRLQ